MGGLLRRFLRNQQANVAIIFALTLPVMVAGAGYGVETTYWYYKRLHMQAAADAAAHAGALEKRGGSNDATVIAVATLTASDNGFATPDATVTVNTPPTSGPSAGADAVEVMIASHEARFFTALFSEGEVDISTRAVAKFTTASSACILALNPTAGSAANFSGNTSVTFDGCSVMANSIASDAVNEQGSATVSTDCLISAGGVSTTANLTMTQCTSPITSAPQVGDPFADVPAPAVSGGCQSSSGSTLSPGRYCHGLSLSGTVTLSPGVYVVESNDFKVNANAHVSGSGVTIYLTDGARITMNGNSQTNLSAPTSGTYAGVLFFGDRNDLGGVNKVNGNNSSTLTGAVYFKSQQVSYLGNFSGSGGCVQVVADTIDWSGSSTVAADCTAYGMRTLPAYSLVKLSE